MNRANNVKDKKKQKPGINEQNQNSTVTFTADMHFIVTRNTRNVWVDEMYETPPEYANLPIFN